MRWRFILMIRPPCQNFWRILLVHLIARFLLQCKTCFLVSIGNSATKTQFDQNFESHISQIQSGEKMLLSTSYCMLFVTNIQVLKTLWKLLYQSSHFVLLILLSPKSPWFQKSYKIDRPVKKCHVMSCNSNSSCWLLRTKWPSNTKQSPRDVVP